MLLNEKNIFSVNFDAFNRIHKSQKSKQVDQNSQNKITVKRMNVNDFREGIELMSHSGFKLTDLESALIENSLIILQSDNKFQNIFFVGRIDTSGTDRYYVAFGYSKDVLKDRKFFYSLNGHEWVMMPELKPKLMPIARNVKTSFRGDPAFVECVSMVKLLINFSFKIYNKSFFLASDVHCRRRPSFSALYTSCEEDQRRRPFGMFCFTDD